ncbi:molybdopterin synthase (large subunit) [Candidatus Hydrogenisulfobacillus filiaventi]|uniref:Molybdopterin synthase (Large subunit) n=1 Tax=Candidatus Hydrogenisulfobacillus filiaventi TaxID=2707344 RepID=A0A6F8ZIL8_9FIRM|nr:molybdenum cofactor biosynthesis protein MoaE [Bacillota bacterium]CAB1129782.1 molybdopterin synthase (large subunit) [Candidatus Hydrogenisulfobacillus filiaventi]
MKRYALVREPIRVEACLEDIQDPACGGQALFLGTVRNEFEGRPTRGLFYDAYPALAEKELARIGAELEAEFGVRNWVLVHRVGELAVGEVSVVVAVSAPHREAAFAACRAGIDRIKARVPIWKKELWADGGARWHDEPPAR